MLGCNILTGTSQNWACAVRSEGSITTIEQLHNAYPGRRIRGIDTSEPSGDIIFVFPCVFLMAIFLKYLCNFFLSGLDPTTYITKSVFLRGMYRYQICWGKTHRKSTFLNLHFVYMLFYHCMKYQNGCF